MISQKNNPSFQDFNYTWFCRVVAPEYEDWHAIDDEEFPVYDPLKARGVPRPKDAILINAPPGLYSICAVISKPNNVYLVQKKNYLLTSIKKSTRMLWNWTRTLENKS